MRRLRMLFVLGITLASIFSGAGTLAQTPDVPEGYTLWVLHANTERTDAELRAHDPLTGAVRDSVAFPESSIILAARLSPDGRYVAAAEGEISDYPPGWDAREICLFHRSGALITCEPNYDPVATPPHWAPDIRSTDPEAYALYYAGFQFVAENDPTEVHVMLLSVLEDTTLLSTAYTASYEGLGFTTWIWSPDGTYALTRPRSPAHVDLEDEPFGLLGVQFGTTPAYDTIAGPVDDLAVSAAGIVLQTGNALRLARFVSGRFELVAEIGQPVYQGRPLAPRRLSLSDDGSRLAFLATYADAAADASTGVAAQQLYVLDRTTGEITLFGEYGSIQEMAWSPDGQMLALVGCGDMPKPDDGCTAEVLLGPGQAIPMESDGFVWASDLAWTGHDIAAH